ncbi:BadF/BadG/BcrA/BcrD ATPase family protein [Aquimarina algiphila]|uniref:BadF/BadG/BcrA/BcrD ATPase family protein n=1 Tax=Aquimarina algiphila TaxID=2047982 RepID=UPI00232F5D6F|nr:BadF/BadG/BcrA/BcrD ATPase family protein [Aquimarina algiphila]
MILCADSGSTKCDWVLINNNGQPVYKFLTHGINPLLLSKNDIQSIIQKEDLIVQKSDLIHGVYFYGAGCGEAKSKKKINLVLQSIFKNVKEISIEEDIIGAVKATTQKPGIVCILGTGANSCYFDGKKVIQKFPALGYLLADEGSGNYFGKILIKDYFLGQMPLNMASLFKQEYDTDLDQLLNILYRTSFPNKYLASFAKFIFRNRGNIYIEEILHEGILNFIRTYLFQYKEELCKYPIHFVGSVAYYSQDVIKKELDNYGYQVKSFIKKPIDHLVKQIVQQEILQKIN